MDEAGEIRVDRAPVPTPWAAVVAERLGHGPDTAITLGRAVAGSSARAKARAVGLEEGEREEGTHEGVRHPRPDAPSKTVRLFDRDVPVAEVRGAYELWTGANRPHRAPPAPTWNAPSASTCPRCNTRWSAWLPRSTRPN